MLRLAITGAASSGIPVKDEVIEDAEDAVRRDMLPLAADDRDWLGHPLVLVLPASLRGRVYVLAPDLWTVRSFTADLPSPRLVTRGEPAPVELPPARLFSLPPPTAAEKEWARLLTRARAEGGALDPWDGLRAAEAAQRRGSLANARRIASQALAQALNGEVDEDAASWTAEELLARADAAAEESPSRILMVALQRLGRVELEAGRLELARALVGRALEIAERRADQPGAAAGAGADLSMALYDLGHLERRAGRVGAARDLLRRRLELDEERAAAPDAGARERRALWLALHELGDLEGRAGELDRARELLERALGWAEPAAEAQGSQARRDLRGTLTGLGDLEWVAGNLDRARGLYRRALELAEELAEDGAGAEAWRDLALALERLGLVEEATGDPESARELYARSLAVYEQLAAANPESAQAALDCVTMHRSLVDVGRALDDVALQREHLEAGAALLDTLEADGRIADPAQAQSHRRCFDEARARLDAAADD